MKLPQKVRILGIAPYEGLEKNMLIYAKERDDVELTTCTADLDAGVEMALAHSDYDVIISRGATAKRIAAKSAIPVVEIPVSVYDVLRVMKLAENYSGNYAIVGFLEVTKTAQMLCDLLSCRIPIHTVENEACIPGILKNLRDDNCSIILCDAATESITKTVGLTPLLITSGAESIRAAFDSAVQLCQGYIALHDNNQLLREALSCQPGNSYVFTEENELVLNTAAKGENKNLVSYLASLLPDLKKNSFKKAFHLIDERLYAVSLHVTHIRENTYYIFTLEENPLPQGGNRYGIRFSNAMEMRNQYYGSFYSLTKGAAAVEEKSRLLADNGRPVMILGEKGSGKDQAAAKLYIDSCCSQAPYIHINCELLNPKNWDYLIHNYNSPLCDNNNTLFISNIQALSTLQRKQLLSLALDTNLARRNRLILSCSETQDDMGNDPARDFIDYLSCIVLNLPPLRKLTDDLASSSSLYLNTLNIKLSKEIIGFTPEAMKLLKTYRWPQNYMQLERVLAELVMQSEGPFIQLPLVEKILEKERTQFPEAKTSPSSSFDYNRPLSEMTTEIIRTVLDNCGGNQSKAAKQLGIGRTTLWRYLK